MGAVARHLLRQKLIKEGYCWTIMGFGQTRLCWESVAITLWWHDGAPFKRQDANPCSDAGEHREEEEMSKKNKSKQEYIDVEEEKRQKNGERIIDHVSAYFMSWNKTRKLFYRFFNIKLIQ